MVSVEEPGIAGWAGGGVSGGGGPRVERMSVRDRALMELAKSSVETRNFLKDIMTGGDLGNSSSSSGTFGGGGARGIKAKEKQDASFEEDPGA